MLNERISLSVKHSDGRIENIDIYDMTGNSLNDCCETERELAAFVLEVLAIDLEEELSDAVKVEATSLVTKAGKEILRLATTIR